LDLPIEPSCHNTEMAFDLFGLFAIHDYPSNVQLG
jgi:hypothetical protein